MTRLTASAAAAAAELMRMMPCHSFRCCRLRPFVTCLSKPVLQTCLVFLLRPHQKMMIVLFSRKRWVGGEEFKKNNFYRRIGMKNESMEQLNALKSCTFSPGAIWSEQQVMSMVTIHVLAIRKTRNLNPESFKRNFNGLKNNLKNKKWGRGRFRGSAGDDHQLCSLWGLT